MSTTFWGMDTAQVREHAQACRIGSDELGRLRARLDAAVAHASWSGHDADAFCASWAMNGAGAFERALALLERSAEELRRQAAQQDLASDPIGALGTGGPTGAAASQICTPPPPLAGADKPDGGYRHRDNPWIPNWFEDPAEQLLSDTARGISDASGALFGGGVDSVEALLTAYGLRTDGVEQFRRDADHLGGILTDLATGERVPTISELGAASIVASASAGVGVYEAATGEDTPLFDDRRGGNVTDVREMPPGPAPQDLADLIAQNNELRTGGGVESGQIGVQKVQPAGGREPVYIVQIPPTEGADITDPKAWGEQGNSRDWASNLRLVAGQHPAAMDDVEAAMRAAGVPSGANVMLVGHSQGGIIAAHLAADPRFNNPCGGAGSYNVTNTFSFGSPVQTVVPAQPSTHVVNISHGPEGLDPHVVTRPVTVRGPGGVPIAVPMPVDVTFQGDPIAQSDLQGRQVDGGTLRPSNVDEVVLPGYRVPASDGVQASIEPNHQSLSKQDPTVGYHPSVAAAQQTDPTLKALQSELEGTYLGPDAQVVSSTVVTVSRNP